MPFSTEPVSKKAFWLSVALAVPPVLLLLFSGVIKLIQPAGAAQGFALYGYTPHVMFEIGIVEIACTLIYLIPQLSVLGAILLTGYLGGAVASNVRIENNQFFMPAILGIMVWAALYMRDPRIRALIPLKK
jgi:hypothetical protein